LQIGEDVINIAMGVVTVGLKAKGEGVAQHQIMGGSNEPLCLDI
jgi:hypothetical protein